MLFLIALCLLATSEHVLGECSAGCKEPNLLYEELKCKPIFTSPEDCCPSKHDCSHIVEKGKENAEKCYFLGKSYGSGEGLNDDDIYGNCKVDCSCRKGLSGKMGFTCAVLDCPEWLGYRPEFGCHFKYELDKCCAGNQICPPFNVTCQVGDKTYREGDKFDSPDDKCTECVCQQGFEGKFEAPFCKKRGCIEEVYWQQEVYHFCAPTYISLDDCCPFNWVCPVKNDTIVSAKTPSKDTNLKCTFGETSLNIGDKFERTSGEKGKLSCECRIPPYLTCIQNYDYPAYAPPID